MKNRILIVEDHVLLRETWAEIINAWATFEVVGQCSSGEAALPLTAALLPDIVLMDINLPGMNGMEASKQLLRQLPELRILIVSLHAQTAYVKRMMDIGAYGYLTKNAGREELLEALQAVAEKKKYISREIKDNLSQEMLTDKEAAVLSKREWEVVEEIKTGYTSNEIAAHLGLTVKTIEVHRYNILRKLKLRNSAALVDYVNRQGL